MLRKKSTHHHNADATQRHSIVYNLSVLILTIFSLLVMVGLLLGTPNYEILWRVDFFICLIFLIDFALNIWRTPDKLGYFFMGGGWLDLLGAIPTIAELPMMPLLRLCRLNRVVRTVKYLRGIERDQVMRESRQTPAKTALLSTILSAIVLVAVTSLVILPLERGAPNAEITSGRDAFWWALVTITTVGYGDLVPVTTAGRIVTVVLMIFGIGNFAVLTSFITANVATVRGGEQEIAAIVRTETAAIRAELANIRELMKQCGAAVDAPSDKKELQP